MLCPFLKYPVFLHVLRCTKYSKSRNSEVARFLNTFLLKIHIKFWVWGREWLNFLFEQTPLFLYTESGKEGGED